MVIVLGICICCVKVYTEGAEISVKRTVVIMTPNSKGLSKINIQSNVIFHQNRLLRAYLHGALNIKEQ